MPITKKNKDGLTEKEFLKQYNPGDYDRPSVTVDMLVLSVNPNLDGLKVLLIQRNEHPFLDCWALPGGFVHIDESAYEAACRELKEETGLSDVYLEQLYTMSQPNRDPRMRVIDIAYMALISTTAVVAGTDAKAAAWFDVHMSEDVLEITNDEMQIKISYGLEKKVFQNGVITIENFAPVLQTQEALAFDHGEIVMEGLLRLRNKVEYTDIAFNLMPEKFTLPDLQKVYEIILGKVLYKTNFRDKIQDKVEALNVKGPSIIGSKKSLLYKYRKG